jgi:hypothetical protein
MNLDGSLSNAVFLNGKKLWAWNDASNWMSIKHWTYKGSEDLLSTSQLSEICFWQLSRMKS